MLTEPEAGRVSGEVDSLCRLLLGVTRRGRQSRTIEAVPRQSRSPEASERTHFSLTLISAVDSGTIETTVGRRSTDVTVRAERVTTTRTGASVAPVLTLALTLITLSGLDAGAPTPLTVSLSTAGVSVNETRLPPADPAFINNPALDEQMRTLDAAHRHVTLRVEQDVSWKDFTALVAWLLMTNTTATVETAKTSLQLETLTKPGPDVTALYVDRAEVVAVSLDQGRTKWKRNEPPPAPFVAGLTGRVIGLRAKAELPFSDVVSVWQQLGCTTCRATFLVAERTWSGATLAAAAKTPATGAVVSDIVVKAPATTDRDAIAEVFNAHTKEVSGCYERSLKQAPDNAGKLVVSFVIGTAGETVSAKVASQDPTLAPSVGACVVEVLQKWKWPPREKPTTIRYPYTFNSR